MRCFPSRLGLAWIASLVGLLAACAPPERTTAPPESVIRPLVLGVIGTGDPAAVPPELLAGLERTEQGVVYRPATAEERDALWLPPPIRDIVIEEVRCKYFPVWRVAYRPLVDGEEGPLLVTELVDMEREGYRVLLRWRRAIVEPDGTLRPDVRPTAPGREADLSEGPRVTVAAHTPWTDLRMERR
jgi:hypothetical protein